MQRQRTYKSKKNRDSLFAQIVKGSIIRSLRQFTFLSLIVLHGTLYAKTLDSFLITVQELKAMQDLKSSMVIDTYNQIIKGRTFHPIEQTCSFDAVKQSLGDDEIAIEIFVVPDTTGQNEYFAFTVRKDYETPHICWLFDEDKLNHEMERKDSFFTDTVAATMLLNPLNEELSGIRRIFLTPAGKLHLFAIEYCNTGNGVMLSEKYEFFRLTSSAVLTHRKDKYESYKSHAIFGGIDFDMLPDFEEKYDSYSSEYSYGYLQDSYQAAIDIHKNLLSMGLHGKLYANDAATETSLKALSGQDISILFIETHGVTDPRQRDSSYPNALMLAGASYVMNGGIIPEGKEDELLTLEEIAKLDLSSVDLAVISACKSALGDIGYQGVSGLMSAFKTAGVNSLIMTTDNVIDHVAGEVWKGLFRNINNSMSKRESLLDAIKHIKIIQDGFYCAPKYWTPFILIDGLN